MTNDRITMLTEAKAEYDKIASSHYDEVLHQVTERIAESGSVGKLDIAALTTWKRLNASTTWVKDLMALPDSAVREQTKSAVNIARQTPDVVEAADLARRELGGLPGCGSASGAMPSAILTAAVPDRFAIYDRRAHAGMNRLGILLQNKNFGLYARYMGQVEGLRAELQAHGLDWTARDVDLALYQLGGRAAIGGE